MTSQFCDQIVRKRHSGQRSPRLENSITSITYRPNMSRMALGHHLCGEDAGGVEEAILSREDFHAGAGVNKRQNPQISLRFVAMATTVVMGW